ncbi:mycofactocin-coupled SDR family oxidoreductase [Pseudonocardia pini]|uniref:mycofactocin-coupled SDR family oxidoreductase n=1 Tax=Pseudonocardia pini TaxID=2758030 RepID=UPI0015F0EC1B|nr:mycofactocin-coupled SDR family oxidoreductase [Pseudonocardia pini]
MGKLEGKVAFITGAARGQGRSHALRLAGEGADIIAVDICKQIPSVRAPMSVPDDLDETVALVKDLGRRIVARQADVRDLVGLTRALEEGVSELGPVDIVLANAGIAPQGQPEDPGELATIARDVIDVNLMGVWNTVVATAPGMIERGRGGAMVLTSSTQGIHGRGGDGSAATSAYTASKHGVVGLMRSFGHWLAPHSIRVNTICPTGVATPMVQNDVVTAWIENNPEGASQVANLMPVPLIEPADLSNAILFLVSDEGRYITGVNLPVDAGFMIK